MGLRVWYPFQTLTRRTWPGLTAKKTGRVSSLPSFTFMRKKIERILLKEIEKDDKIIEALEKAVERKDKSVLKRWLEAWAKDDQRELRRWEKDFIKD